MLLSNAQAEHSYVWLCTDKVMQCIVVQRHCNVKSSIAKVQQRLVKSCLGMVSRRLVRQRNGKAWHGDGIVKLGMAMAKSSPVMFSIAQAKHSEVG
jgi:hypothetical protein